MEKILITGSDGRFGKISLKKYIQEFKNKN